MSTNFASKLTRAKNKELSSSRSSFKFMGNVSVESDLEGRLGNLPDFSNEALFPVFEAIVNSIQAIHERKMNDRGRITIRIVREIGDQYHLPNENDSIKKEKAKLKNFEIEDDGVGFNKNNFESFKKLDSTYKKKIGGKGIGRLYWLKYFNKVEVESVFFENNCLNKRRFNFTKDHWVTGENTTNLNENAPLKTKIKLIAFKKRHHKKQTLFQNTERIAEHILKYCMSYYIMNNAPVIIIEDSKDIIYLDELYKTGVQQTLESNFTVESHSFKICHTKLSSKYTDGHKLVLCANDRTVKDYSLQQHLSSSPFVDVDNSENQFYYVGYISSDYLDSHLDNSRTTFYISEDEEENFTPFTGDLTIQKIKDKAFFLSKQFLSVYVNYLQNLIEKKVDECVFDNPTLRYIPKHCPEIFKDIDADSSPEKIRTILFKYKGVAELELQKEATELLKTKAKHLEEIEDKYKEINKKISDFNKDNLAGYVLRRKIIIDLLNKKLQLNSDEKYQNEEIIHDIIFPMKTTTDEIKYEDHNLWIIDEQLTFHHFAASDKQLSAITTSDSEMRPDIIICSEKDDDGIARSISIIEFKKPQRPNFDVDPVTQMFNTIRKIRNQTIKTHGRGILVDPATRYYCYAICDRNTPINEYIENHPFSTMKDNLGYYMYNPNLNAYIELLLYDKIIIDVNKRHKIFFEKLGIPHSV